MRSVSIPPSSFPINVLFTSVLFMENHPKNFFFWLANENTANF